MMRQTFELNVSAARGKVCPLGTNIRPTSFKNRMSAEMSKDSYCINNYVGRFVVFCRSIIIFLAKARKKNNYKIIIRELFIFPYLHIQ